MEFALTQPPAPPASIADIAIRHFAVGDDEEAIYYADEEAFLDQRGHTPRTFEQWRRRLNQSDATPDPTLWLIAWDANEVVGAALGEAIGDVGWIHHLFVRRPWRRRSLGAELTRAALAAFYQRSIVAVRLNVDAQSLTDAQALYRRVGFRVIGGYANFEKIVALP
jgi:ribosomal protein S18 acetylase RimI-like enzyme